MYNDLELETPFIRLREDIVGCYLSFKANLAKSLDLTQRTAPRDMDDIFPLDLPIPTTSWPPERNPDESHSTGQCFRSIFSRSPGATSS